MLENRGRSRLQSGYLPRFCLESVADITKKAVRNELLFRCSPREYSKACVSMSYKVYQPIYQRKEKNVKKTYFFSFFRVF